MAAQGQLHVVERMEELHVKKIAARFTLFCETKRNDE